jgi:hypothetical protein
MDKRNAGLGLWMCIALMSISWAQQTAVVKKISARAGVHSQAKASAHSLL